MLGPPWMKSPDRLRRDAGQGSHRVLAMELASGERRFA
jgi:hypothetical protein